MAYMNIECFQFSREFHIKWLPMEPQQNNSNSKSKNLYEGCIKLYASGAKLYEKILPSEYSDFQDSPPSPSFLETLDRETVSMLAQRVANKGTSISTPQRVLELSQTQGRFYMFVTKKQYRRIGKAHFGIRGLWVLRYFLQLTY